MLAVADFTDGGAALDVHRRISPERRRTLAYEPSRRRSCTEVPAARASWAPLPGTISMQWIVGADRDVADQR